MEKLFIEPSPHIKSTMSTQKVMLHVLIALFPALVAATVIFGLRALFLTVICATSCVIFEWLFRKITKREQTISDLSAVVTGVLLAFNLPANLPIYMAVVGSFVAIVVVKQMFGGIGQNFANPAITARIVLMLSFTSSMTTWVKPFWYNITGTDAVTGATPLVADELPSVMDMMLGVRGGCLGETCAIALIIGGIYLVAMKIITPVTPIAFVGTVALFSFIGGQDVVYSVLSGGLLLGAIFMATDYATTPLTWKGKLIFGIGCGLITCLIRNFGSMPEGVSYSILLMNIITPYIDKLTRPKPFGTKKEADKA
ncbi:MAG: RnfABCDGE type electron transport complex subunit D [Ruminiclostridium sp.]